MKAHDIDPKIYDRQYFFSDWCEGFAEFEKNSLSPIKQEEIKLLNLKTNDKVLDIGCGRGDIAWFLSQNHYDFWAIDYSTEAISLTKTRVRNEYHQRIILCDARMIDMPSNSFDKILLGDIIEHMTFQDAIKTINQAHRLLNPGGILVIHTSPNLWFKKLVYPLAKIFLILFRQQTTAHKLEKTIQASFTYHIDEYTPLSLRQLMKRTNFKQFKVWIKPDVLRQTSDGWLRPLRSHCFFRTVAWLANNTPLIAIFGNDLFVRANK